MSPATRYHVMFTESRRWESNVVAASAEQAAEMVIARFCEQAAAEPDELDDFWFLECLPVDIELVCPMDGDCALLPAEFGGAL